MKRKPKLSVSERIKIQILLERNLSFSEIAQELNRSVSTISREVGRNATIKNKDGSKCPKRLMVCNKCSKRYYCSFRQIFYSYEEAQNKAENRNESAQNRTKLSPEVITTINDIVTPGVRNSKSLHHVYFANPILKTLCSERTIRRLIYRRELEVKAHELRRYVRYKRTYQKNNKLWVRNIEVLYGRLYEDFLNYVKKHKRMNIVQYDSVIGKRDDKQALLTIMFPKYNFQFGFLIKKDNPNDVNHKLRLLFRKLGDDAVRVIFPINVADNGSEFSYFNRLELNSAGQTICRTFFTRPYRSNDKASCERNHELIRYCLPKGKSLNFLTQDQVDEMFSNINCLIRKSINNSTPYELVLRKYGQEFMDTIGIQRISTKKVRLTQLI